MAYRSLEREASFAYGSSSSCLDGVPFTISSQFQIPNKVKIQPDFIKSPKHAREEYNFEIEEGVMKWAQERERALERERQLQAQRLEEEVKSGKVKRGPITITEEGSDSEPEDVWLKNNVQPTACQTSTHVAVPNIVRQRPKPSPRQPQPRGPVISNGILTPVPICPVNNENKITSGTNKSVDVTLFETEDDPFDMFERQTLNDMEELKNVFQCTDQSSNVTTTQPLDSTQQSLGNTSTQLVENTTQNTESIQNLDIYVQSNQKISDVSGGANVNSAFSVSPEPSSDIGDYITLKDERKPQQIDLNKLPPIPPRRFLSNNDPLPPINFQNDSSAIPSETVSKETTNNSTNYENVNILQSNPFLTDTFTNAQPLTHENVTKSNFKTVDSDIPHYENIDIQRERVVFTKKNDSSSSSHESLLKSAKDTKNSTYVNVAPGLPFGENAIRSAKSNPDIVKTVNGVTDSSDVFDKAPFPISRSPPYRPSSQQSWNKYSPLPSPCSVSKSSSTSDFASPSEVDPYVRLTPEGQEAVNNLVSMGFSRPRVARSVENFGCDEKEIVEHLFIVDKMSEAGFDTYQSEQALVIFKNNKDKAEVYLRIFKQFQELGFSTDRIKEALVKFDNDSDKALDYLTK